MRETLRRELPRIGHALNAELYKVMRRRMTYILLLSLGLLVTLFYVILWLRIRDGPGDRPGGFAQWLTLRSAMSFFNVVPYGLALERFFATLVCVIFAGTMMGNEFDWRTVGVVTARGVRRWHFLLAKAVIAIVFTAAAVLTGFAVALAWSAWFSNLYGLPFGSFGGERFVDALFSLARTAFVILPFVFFALLCATVWRSAGQAVGASLGAYFIEGVFTGLLNNARGWLSEVPQALVNINGDAIMRANGIFAGEGGGGPFIFGPGGTPIWRATMVVLAWTLGFVVLVFWQFRRRDIQE